MTPTTDSVEQFKILADAMGQFPSAQVKVRLVDCSWSTESLWLLGPKVGHAAVN